MLNKKRLDFDLYRIVGMLLGAFVFVPYKLKPYLVVIFVVMVLFSKPSIRNWKMFLHEVLPISLMFFLYVLSLLNTNNINYGVSLIGRILPLVLIPVSFSLLSLDKRLIVKETFEKIFPITLSLYSIVIFIYLNALGCFSGDSSFEYGYSFITNEFFGLYDHPIYISTYFSVGMLILLNSPYKSKIVKGLLFLLILAGLLILSRKGSILAVLFCLVFYFISYKKTTIKIFLFITIILSVLLFSNVRNRFEEVITQSKIDKNPETSSGIRIIVWETALKASFDPNNFFGHGVGEVQGFLNEQYKSQGFIRLTHNNYNAHNQFLQVALTTGIIGFIVFIAGLIYLGLRLQKSKNKDAFFILLFFMLIFLTESYLERQNGVFFFALIISMFTFVNNEKKDFNNRPYSTTNIRS